MGRKSYVIVTNNPLVLERLGSTHNVEYADISYEGVLEKVRDKIHLGHTLLSHPLSGSVKPNETPYKSVMVSVGTGQFDMNGLEIIELALQSCKKFQFRSDKYAPHVYEDFRIIDCTLIESGCESADLW